MEKYADTIKKRSIYLIIALVITVITYIGLTIKTDSFARVLSFIQGYNLGIFIGLILLIIFHLFRNYSVLKENKKLKKMYIKENDERSKVIRQKAGASATYILNFSFVLATVVAGFFNEVIFYTLLAVIFSTFFVVTTMKIYYEKTI